MNSQEVLWVFSMSFRKEKKYRLTKSDLILFKEKLQVLGMQKLYNKRLINSHYFDTDDMAMYRDSEEGVLPRKKVRVRWYGNAPNFTKEIKISSLEGRYKTSDSLDSLGSEEEVLQMRFLDSFYGALRPSLKVSYDRSYYNLGGLRITFDTNIYYHNTRLNFFIKKIDPDCVAEVKVPIDCDDDYIEKIILHRTSRFSKYSRGLLIFDSML